MRGTISTRSIIRRAAATAVAAAAAVLGCAGAAQAAGSGANGAIAFATGHGIAVIQPDGSGFARLTRRDDRSPAWSPDGGRIAFERGGDIWVMNADGSHQRRATRTPAVERHPTWSPDGRRIAYESDGSIVVAGSTGGPGRRVAAGRQPDWSPRGDRIAYVSDALVGGDYPMGPRSSVWTVAPDGGRPERVRLTSYAADPDWSPAGDRIAFDQTSAIGTANWTAANGSGPLHALGASLGGDPLAAGPAWAPDGRYLAYSVTRPDGRTTIAVENAATGAVRTIAASGTAPDWQPASRAKARRVPPRRRIRRR